MKTGSANVLRVLESSPDNGLHLEGRSNSPEQSTDVAPTSSSLVDTIQRRGGCEDVAMEGIFGKQSRGNEAPPHREENVNGSDPGWEGFLSPRQLSVLLVENDSSTRHVVAALLRNCSYGVYSACNGLEAWERLNDPANHFDLLLTEVVMPSLSGIGLLYKIMTHKAYKHIPVIMMSAEDSVGVVLKCLSKGAADFLVKPLRKNELKNLWQHVWRRSHSPSGSGSGTHNVPQPKSGSTVSGNNTGSNDESDNITLNVMDGSDNGSGTQSSWTKRAFRIESPLYRCVQEKPIGSHMEDPQSNRASGTVDIAERRAIQREIEADTSQDLKVATRKVAHHKFHNAKDMTSPETSFVCALKHNVSSTSSKERGQAYEHTIGSQGHSMIAIDLIHSVACNNKETHEENGDNGFTIAKNKETHEEKGVSGCSSSSSFLELILKGPCAKHLEGGVEDRKILRHSGSSAFSRYNAPNNFNLPLSGACSNSIHPLRPGYGNDEMGVCMRNSVEVVSSTSQGNNAFNQSGFNEHAKLKSTNPQTHHSHHHHHHSYDYPHHQHQSKPSDPSKPQREDKSAITMDICGSGPQCSSNSVNVSEGGNNGQMGSNNCCGSVENGNESITGSFNGNDGHNNGHNNRHRNDQKDHLPSLTSARIIANSSQNVNVGAPPLAGNTEAEQSRVAIREATLTKFRQKRKNRCYEKKVRYQSRKKLAEQRPRVRGQFVRQNVYSCEQE